MRLVEQGSAAECRRLGALVTALVALLVLVLPAGAFGRSDSARRAPETIEGRYIVVYERSVGSPAQKTERLERAKSFKSSVRYERALKGFAAKLSDGQVRALRTDPDVVSVTPDRRVRGLGPVPLATGEPTPPSGVRRIEAATTTTTREASGAGVAVIDTGVDLDHPDLNVASGKNCVTAGAPADDDNGHGTHVAGTIGAENDGSGQVGVAPGTRVRAVKVLDGAGSGSLSGVICGIDWVTATRTDGDPANDVAVANMSLGGLGPPVESCAATTDPEHRAICNSTAAGVTYVVAAGNDGWDFDYAPQPDVPAAYPEVLTVAAMADSDGRSGGAGGSPACRTGEYDDRYASFSNFAKTAAGEQHTIAAPGVCIRSSAPGGGSQTMSGTSMAAPHISGAVALCLEEGGIRGPCSGLSPAQIVDRFRAEAASHTGGDGGYGFAGDPTRPVSGRYYGYLDWAGIVTQDTAAPTIMSMSPSDGQIGVATTAGLSVTFSEGMDRTATEAAFSLARSSDGAPVAGSFSWSANTMTFRPSAPLAQGAAYTAKVSNAARDAAGNALAAEKSWGFKTLASFTAFPSSTVIQTGSLRGGGSAQLASDDNSYYHVNSTTTGTRTTAWYGRFTGISNDLRTLKLTHKGKNSLSCTQTLAVWRWTTSTWVGLDSRTVGTTEVQVDKAPTGTLADYVSGTSGDGEVRVRVRCTRSSSGFYASGDLLKAVYERP